MKENKQVNPAVSSCTAEIVQKDGLAKISRSPGIAVHNYIVGGGWRGCSNELDTVVMRDAEFLRDHYHINVTIRFNSNRLSGGAWLIDSKKDGIGSNSSIGLGASLVNSRLRAILLEEKMKMSSEEFRRLCRETDSMMFSTHRCRRPCSPHTSTSRKQSTVYPQIVNIFFWIQNTGILHL